MLAVVVLPGWMWLRVVSYRLADARVSLLVQVAAAPVLSFGLLAVLANVGPKLGVTWSASYGVTTMLVVAALGLALDFFVRRGRHRRVSRESAPWRWDWPLIGVIAGAFTLAALPLLVFADPRNPLQQWDPSFHYNGVWQMVRGGDSSIYGLSGMFGVEGGAHTYYPDLWHAFVALFATPETVLQTVNTSSLAILFWWIMGMAGFVHYMWGNRLATFAATVISALLLSFPADFVSMYTQWPNASSMALLPGLLMLAWIVGNAWVRALFSGERGGAWTWTFVFLLAALGAVAMHPISFFNALVFVLVPFAAAMARLMKGARRARKTGTLALLILVAVGGVAVTVVAVFNPRTLATASFERNRSLLDALVRPFVPVPPFPLTVGFVIAIVAMVALLVVGLRRAWITRKARWITGTWAIFAVLVFLAYAPNFGLQILTGPWYSDPRRLMGAMQVALVLLFTLATLRLAQWLQKRSIKEGAAILLVIAVTGAGAIDARSLAVRAVYDPEHLGPAGMATAQELALFRSANQLLPEDALVLGDPSIGTVYFQALGNRRVVFPGLTTKDANPDVSNLTTSFRNIHDDPAICDTLNRIGVTHFYAGEDEAYYKLMRSEVRPGFYGVDTSRGFEPVASVNGGTLYEITACR